MANAFIVNHELAKEKKTLFETSRIPVFLEIVFAIILICHLKPLGFGSGFYEELDLVLL